MKLVGLDGFEIFSVLRQDLFMAHISAVLFGKIKKDIDATTIVIVKSPATLKKRRREVNSIIYFSFDVACHTDPYLQLISEDILSSFGIRSSPYVQL